MFHIAGEYRAGTAFLCPQTYVDVSIHKLPNHENLRINLLHKIVVKVLVNRLRERRVTQRARAELQPVVVYNQESWYAPFCSHHSFSFWGTRFHRLSSCLHCITRQKIIVTIYARKNSGPNFPGRNTFGQKKLDRMSFDGFLRTNCCLGTKCRAELFVQPIDTYSWH